MESQIQCPRSQDAIHPQRFQIPAAVQKCKTSKGHVGPQFVLRTDIFKALNQRTLLVVLITSRRSHHEHGMLFSTVFAAYLNAVVELPLGLWRMGHVQKYLPIDFEMFLEKPTSCCSAFNMSRGWKAFERVSLPVVLAWATHFCFPKKILRVLCGYFEHQRRVQFEGCAAGPLQTITAILPGSKWSCSLLRIVLQDALSEVTKNVPSVEIEGLCG